MTDHWKPYEEFVQYSSDQGKKYLYKSTQLVKNISSPQIQKIIEEMKILLKGKGVGLAANQIGFPYQIFIIH